jgi:hypothetical protein
VVTLTEPTRCGVDRSDQMWRVHSQETIPTRRRSAFFSSRRTTLPRVSALGTSQKGQFSDAHFSYRGERWTDELGLMPSGKLC